MTAEFAFEPATLDHAAFVTRHMRAADVAEAQAFGMHPADGIRLSMRASTKSMTWLLRGEPIAVFGVANVNTIEGIGAPWMACTDRTDTLARAWLVLAPRWLDFMGEGYFVLRNYVDERNIRSKRWLRHMGFTIHPPFSFGRTGASLQLFERTT